MVERCTIANDMKDVKIICAVCGKEHFVTKANKNTKCCSRGCGNTYRASKLDRPVCLQCGVKVYRRASHCRDKVFCSKKCEGLFRRRDRLMKNCKQCGQTMWTTPSKGRIYCSRKCMGVGNRHYSINRKPRYRSFVERVLCELFTINFPELQLAHNDRSQLNGYEIDLYFPQLRQGIECNGQHHFKPVYGAAQFKKTQDRDAKKKMIAAEKSIKLHDLNILTSIGRTHKSRLRQAFLQSCAYIGVEPTQTDLPNSRLAVI